MSRKVLFFLFAAVLLALSFNSCKKDKPLTDTGATLNFSEDTIKFDTVFTTVGSSTQSFNVFNPYSQPVNISSIYLATGAGSNFRLNVNGVPGKSFHDVEIGAKDSIWIFVEVTVDPNNINTPMLITDSIIFVTNGHQQDVDLMAYGQDAYFYPSKNDLKATNASLFVLDGGGCNGGTIIWDKTKPHVVYGYAVVDSGCTLKITEGTSVNFHNNSGLLVLSGGKLIVQGTLQDPVTIQGDRLGFDYKDVAGQWGRIRLSTVTHSNLFYDTQELGAGPAGNTINYAIIKNGFVGMQCDSFKVQHQPALVINNTIMKNFASTALYGQGSNVQANNCVFANCAEYCIAMNYGGDYRFLHCTIANFWKDTERKTPAVNMQNYYIDGVRRLDSAYFGNCIIYGNNDNEVGLDSSSSSGSNFNFRFDNTLYKMTDKVFGSGGAYYVNSIRATVNGPDPQFKNTDDNNYEVYTSSIAVDRGSLYNFNLEPIILSKDIRDNMRPQGVAPDLGAYEVK